MKRTLRQLMRSAVVCFFCITLLTSSTYAWIDSRSAGNEQAELQAVQQSTPAATIKLRWTDDVSSNNWTEANSDGMGNDSFTGIFHYENFEPGFAQVRYLEATLENATGEMVYVITFDKSNDQDDNQLAEVVDVYFVDNIGSQRITRAYLTDANRKGTLAELYEDGEVVFGTLEDGTQNSRKSALVLKMQETAGDSYQGAEANFKLTFKLLTAPAVNVTE